MDAPAGAVRVLVHRGRVGQAFPLLVRDDVTTREPLLLRGGSLTAGGQLTGSRWLPRSSNSIATTHTS